MHLNLEEDEDVQEYVLWEVDEDLLEEVAHEEEDVDEDLPVLEEVLEEDLDEEEEVVYMQL